MSTTETNVQSDINVEVQAFSDWSAAHTGSINAQNVLATTISTEAAKLAALTGSLVTLFSDTTTVVVNKLKAANQDPRALLSPIFDVLVPSTGSY